MLIRELIDNSEIDIYPEFRIIALDDARHSICMYTTENREQDIPDGIMDQEVASVMIGENANCEPYLEITYCVPDLNVSHDDPAVLRARINELLLSVPDYELVEIHNAYCHDTGNTQRRVWRQDEIDDYFSGMRPTDILCKISDDFCVNDRYFWEDNGAVISDNGFDWEWRASYPIDVDAIAEYAVHNQTFYNEWILGILPQ